MSKSQLREADRLEVMVLVDNYADVFLEGTEVARRREISPGKAPLAEHGLSCLLKVGAGSEEHLVLIDAGTSAVCLPHNIDTFEVDLSKIESVVLSHGHIDHYGGLTAFLDRAGNGMPVVLHPDAFLERRLNVPDKEPVEMIPRLDEVQLKERGAEIQKRKKASTIASDLVLVTGEVERVSSFEKGFAWAEAKINGQWVVDPFHDDQGVAVNVRGRGLVVIGGCSHSGIINIVQYARKVAQTEKVRAVLGGFHLSGRLFKSVIDPTIEEMKKIGPDFVVPMHCTGWEAINRFAVEMPEQVLLNSVGTTYIF